MPRFYFHTEDGKCLPDRDGTVLADISAARHEGLRTLTERVHAMEDEFWREGSLTVTATDDTGMTLFTLCAMANNSPALGSGR